MLARLLTPDEFGAVALIGVFTGLATVFVDGGFSFALIQRQDITPEDVASVFWLNLGMAALIFFGLVAVSEPVAVYLGISSGERLVVVFSSTIVINAAGAVQMAMMTKALEFKSILRVTAFATLLAGSVAILAAVHGLGVWALGLQTLVYASATTALLWIYSPWRPALVVRISSLKRLFSFGSYMFLSAILDRANYGVQNLLIGKSFGIQSLGIYNRAEATQNVPQSIVNGLLSRVLFPVFAKVADDQVRLRRGFGQAIRLAMLVNAPLMLGMLATAGDVVQIVLGDQWSKAVPILQVLCIWGIIWPLHVINLNVLSGLGHSKLFFKVEVIKKVVSVALLVAASAVGLLWVAWAQVVMAVIACAITMYLTNRLIGYRFTSQMRDILPPIAAAAMMAMLVYTVTPALNLSATVKLTILIGVGGATYMLLCFGMRLTAMHEAMELVAPKLANAIWKDAPRLEK
ncbi:lipopolysaccharide biosynthesis protein [Thermomonas sp. HDW16]|nr:lipopolysaccharide biosynthesis protein [Thermomonas sp. HDW16]